MIATVSPSSANCEHTINTLRYADRVKELKSSNNCESSKFINESTFDSQSSLGSPAAFKTSLPVKTLKLPQTPTKLQNSILLSSPIVTEDLTDDLMMNDSSPLKLTESDDSFLLSTFSNSEKRKNDQPISQTQKQTDYFFSSSQTSQTKASASKLKESLHHSIAVLYDRVSNCQDADLLELLGDELESLLAAFNK